MVPGEGPQPALGMIVGEAPGRDEVAQGRPFVGRSGKLLETALRSLGVAREDVYITNVVKELPLDSEDKIRRPTPLEVTAWREILEGEIQNVAPRAILALGRTAANALTGADVPLGSFWAPNIYVAWHPSYLLHRGASYRITRELAQFTEWLDQLRPWARAIQ